ncbi:MAG: hypothetical protein AAB400_01060 [Patescibacteria group bacterium]
MLLIIIVSTYALLLAVWALFSLIIIFHILKYIPISLTGWLMIIIYFLAATSILGWTWGAVAPLIDFNEFSFPVFSTPQSF